MRRLIDLSGQRFGKLTVLPDSHCRENRKTFWRCQCDCGSPPVVVWAASLRRGNTRSCGCLHKEVAAKWTKHGQEGTKLYKTWQGVKRRCLNRRSADYPRYGARGIGVHEDWVSNFVAFALHVGEPPTLKHSIDRIDNDKGYEPGNVRWALPKAQANNTARNRILVCDGESLTVSQWATRTGFSSYMILGRLKLGWPVERALHEPKRGSQSTG